jgi:segregation and condensation protein B
VSNDERSESLAQQAAAWVPPWERQQRPPDRAYQAAAEAEARAAAGDDEESEAGSGELPGGRDFAGAGAGAGAGAEELASAEELAAADDLVDDDDDDAVVDKISAHASDADEDAPDDEEVRSEAGISDDDDYDEAFEGANPPGYWSSPGTADSEPDTDRSASSDKSGMSDGPEEFGPAGDKREEVGADEVELARDGGEAAPGEERDEAALGDEPEEAALGDEPEEAGLDDEPEEAGLGDELEEAALGDEPEEAALGEDAPVSVDQAVGAAGDEPEPSAGEVGPELPLPDAVEDVVEDAAARDAEDDGGLPADAPLPVDGDDAGDVFDQAADDDVSDDGADDLPIDELVPGEDYEDADQPTTQPAAGEPPSASLGKAVPEQGRRRKDSAPAVVGPDTRTINDLPELADEGELSAALEAILLVVDEPVAEMQLAQILEQPTERVGAMLEDISARYTAAGHGFDLRRAAGGWRLYTRPEYAAYVERFVLDGQSVRLTQAALETLAVVAYKQPVTRSRISAIRGVNCDGVMRTLATRGLIEECGVEGETGAHLYRTTPLFLEKLGLNSVDQLPPLAPFLPDDVEEVLDASG